MESGDEKIWRSRKMKVWTCGQGGVIALLATPTITISPTPKIHTWVCDMGRRESNKGLDILGETILKSCFAISCFLSLLYPSKFYKKCGQVDNIKNSKKTTLNFIIWKCGYVDKKYFSISYFIFPFFLVPFKIFSKNGDRWTSS